jgi:hypothetical protein
MLTGSIYVLTLLSTVWNHSRDNAQKKELISAARERSVLEKLLNDVFTRFKLLYTKVFFVSDFSKNI